MVPHTGTILTPSPSHQHDTMLLHIVPCITTQSAKHSLFTISSEPLRVSNPPTTPFSLPLPSYHHANNEEYSRTLPRNITSNSPPTTQPNPRHLPLRGIRLLRLEIVDDPQTDAFHMRSVYQRWRHGMTGALGLAGLFEHLHQGCGKGGCCREGAVSDGVEFLES